MKKTLEEEFLELKSLMEKAEQDRLWDHFVKTGQVLPTLEETMKPIHEIQKQINEIEKMQWVNPFN